MVLGSLLLFAVSTFFYGAVCFVVALALFFFAPTMVHRYLQARSRKDALGRVVRIMTTGALTNEKVVVVMLRVVLAILIVFGALAMAHAVGLKTWIFDS